MNVHDIRRRVMELVPGLVDAHIEPTRDLLGLYFTCTKDKRMRSLFIEVAASQQLLWGMSATVEKSDQAIAAEIAAGLKT